MHYDKFRPRKKDDVLPIRNFHNFVKAVLIRGAYEQILRKHSEPIRFLDFCCGNGGDITKVQHIPQVRYFGIDISKGAVARASERLESIAVDGDVCELNAFSVTCGSMLERMASFHVVSCQFALHYAFSDERTARTAVQNVAVSLKPGGLFIGTIPDAEHLCRSRDALGKRFGDHFYRVKFAKKVPPGGGFGDAYEFTFNNAVEQLTEYVVYKSELTRLCEECGMTLVAWRQFETYNQGDDPHLWGIMNPAFHDVSRLYTTFVFEATGEDFE